MLSYLMFSKGLFKNNKIKLCLCVATVCYSNVAMIEQKTKQTQKDFSTKQSYLL